MEKNSLNINERLELTVMYHKQQKILEAQNFYLEILPEFFFPNNSRKINNNWDSLD